MRFCIRLSEISYTLTSFSWWTWYYLWERKFFTTYKMANLLRLAITLLQKQSSRDLRPATSLKKRLWHRCFPVLQNTSNGRFFYFIIDHVTTNWQIFDKSKVLCECLFVETLNYTETITLKKSCRKDFSESPRHMQRASYWPFPL